MNIKQQLTGTVPFWITAYNAECLWAPWNGSVILPLFAATFAIVGLRAAWRALDSGWTPASL